MPIEPANTTPGDGLVPNPKLRLREQVGEVRHGKLGEHSTFNIEHRVCNKMTVAGRARHSVRAVPLIG